MSGGDGLGCGGRDDGRGGDQAHDRNGAPLPQIGRGLASMATVVASVPTDRSIRHFRQLPARSTTGPVCITNSHQGNRSKVTVRRGGLRPDCAEHQRQPGTVADILDGMAKPAGPSKPAKLTRAEKKAARADKRANRRQTWSNVRQAFTLTRQNDRGAQQGDRDRDERPGEQPSCTSSSRCSPGRSSRSRSPCWAPRSS